MSKYLNKSAEQLQKELAEIQQALEQKEKVEIAAIGAIFSRFLKGIDDAKSAKYHLNIIEKHAEKSEKKSLKILINKLKTIRDFESLENNLQRTTNNSMQDNSKIHQNLATNSINNHSDGSSINPETKNFNS